MESQPRRRELPNVKSGTDAAVAVYIGETAAELAMLATRHDLPLLAYILDMARLEAESQAHAIANQ
jgi:hypothetical protein